MCYLKEEGGSVKLPNFHDQVKQASIIALRNNLKQLVIRKMGWLDTWVGITLQLELWNDWRWSGSYQNPTFFIKFSVFVYFYGYHFYFFKYFHSSQMQLLFKYFSHAFVKHISCRHWITFIELILWVLNIRNIFYL